MKRSQQHPNDIQAAATNQHLPVIQSPKDRILGRIRRSKHSRNNEVPSVAEIAVRIAAVLMMIAVCAEAVSR
jgi:hypothetical protein